MAKCKEFPFKEAVAPFFHSPFVEQVQPHREPLKRIREYDDLVDSWLDAAFSKKGRLESQHFVIVCYELLGFFFGKSVDHALQKMVPVIRKIGLPHSLQACQLLVLDFVFRRG